MPANAEAILRRRDQLKATRTVWESHWSEIAIRVLPRADEFQSRRTPGEKRTEEIFDATAALALERFASALESMLTPRSSRWHHLRASIPELNEDHEVKAWFDQAENILFGHRYAPHGGYASQQHETYMSLGAFGTGVLFVGAEDLRGGFRYRACALSECYIAENQHGLVDVLYRECEYTARAAKQKWPKPGQLPDGIVKAIEKEPDKKFTFVHAVEPREDREPGKRDNKNMAFAEVWVSEEGKKIVEEGGYKRFPYIVSRYVTGPREIYGRSPAMTILPDIKMLNEMNRVVIKQGQLAVEPPVLLYDDGVLGSPGGFGLLPGYLNYGGVTEEGRPLAQAFETKGRVDIGLDLINDRRGFINDAFLVTLFQILVETPNMTATEAMLRAQEKGALIAPVMGRQQSEALGPMIERELGILLDQGRLPPLPPALIEAEGDYEIEYDSPLSRTQKSEEAVGIARTLEMLTPFAALDEGEIFDIFNKDELARAVAHINGVPAKVLNSPEQVQAMRDKRDGEKQMAGLLSAAGPVKDLGGAIKSVAEAGAVANQA